jgi:hypothetical protein
MRSHCCSTGGSNCFPAQCCSECKTSQLNACTCMASVKSHTLQTRHSASRWLDTAQLTSQALTQHGIGLPEDVPDPLLVFLYIEPLSICSVDQSACTTVQDRISLPVTIICCVPDAHQTTACPHWMLFAPVLSIDQTQVCCLYHTQ